MKCYWNPENTPAELYSMLRTLAEEYPVAENPAEANIRFVKVDDPETLSVKRDDNTFVITYGKTAFAARGLAYAMADMECAEKIAFKTYGILFDCTRGNIITVKHFKHWLRRLSLMGYNMAMIYTKDAYQLPDEPYFGYMRGAYSMAEIKEIDAYAKQLNIEIIASIQALGHLEPILRWPAYYKVRDTGSTIMVDNPEALKLVEKIINFWSEALTSRRIHLGMDETHDLGRGAFMDQKGYESPFSIYNRHLGRVCEICKKRNLEPIIWSDMYFRYANTTQNYYDTTSEIPQDVKNAIPSMVQLSYWDYYHRDAEIYEKMLTRTSDLNGSAPFMASGVWTWGRMWTDYETTQATVRPCIKACHKVGAQEVIYTLWGDDGGYCEFNSAFAGLAWAADYAYNQEQEDEERLAKFYQAVCGTSYQLQMACGKLTYTYTLDSGEVVKVPSNLIFWDDPLLGIAWNEMKSKKHKNDLIDCVLADFRQVRDLTAAHRNDTAAGHIDHAWNIANVAVRKLEFRQKLLDAYKAKDKAALKEIAENDVPQMIEDLNRFLASYRIQWKRSFKPFGIELMHIRMGGLCERYRETARMIEEYLNGEIDCIMQLDEKYDTNGNLHFQYSGVATGGFFI